MKMPPRPYLQEFWDVPEGDPLELPVAFTDATVDDVLYPSVYDRDGELVRLDGPIFTEQIYDRGAPVLRKKMRMVRVVFCTLAPIQLVRDNPYLKQLVEENRKHIPNPPVERANKWDVARVPFAEGIAWQGDNDLLRLVTPVGLLEKDPMQGQLEEALDLLHVRHLSLIEDEDEIWEAYS